jgi:hypothetical protein
MYKLEIIKDICLGGEVAEWSKAADCKSAGVSLRRFESCPPHSFLDELACVVSLKLFALINSQIESVEAHIAGVAQLARASAFQAEGRGFESRLPLKGCFAHVAQPVEHILGKDEVSGSSPLVGSFTTIYKFSNA